MGGSIALKSPLFDPPASPGASFTCFLPIKKGTLKREIGADMPLKMAKTRPLKILVAEDNEINQILIQTILEDAHFEVIMVENGQQAIDVALATPIDLILMDIQMPVMGGYDATNEIRKYKPNIPIVALSANAFEEDINKSSLAGMNGHLSKPLQIEKLYATLREIFANQQAEKV